MPDGPVVLVTGATKGIGLEIALGLAGSGATTLMNYRKDDEQAKRALEQARRLSPATELLQADVAEPWDVEGMFRTIRQEYGRLDWLVSNAGISADGLALMMGDGKWRSVVETNLTGAFLCCRAAGRLMMSRRHGAIVAVSSTSAVAAPAGQCNYAASKAGLLALVRVLAKELGAYQIRVNAVVPGFVDTAMTKRMPKSVLEAQLQHVALGRIGQPLDVVPAVRFLLSEDASYITGAALVIDGGLTC